MEQVQRYDDSDNLYDHIVARDDGDYVLYSDYAQLQSELYAANRTIDDQRVKLDTSYITEHGRIKELEAELEAARGERDKWRELEHAAIETAGFNAAQLAAANEKLATLAGGINKWCADCELRHDCIAPNGKPCDLKDAHIAATTKKE